MKLLLLLITISNIYAADTLAAPTPDVYIDKDGDTITILDSVVRNKRRSIKEIKASHIYDNKVDLEKLKPESQDDKKTEEQEIEKTATP